MAKKKRRRVRYRSKDTARAETQPTLTPNAEVVAGANGKPSVKGAPQAFDFTDPVCGDDSGKATPNPDGSWVLDCWKLGCKRSSWFFELAEAIGLRDAYALKEDPERYLAPYITRHVSRVAKPDPLPSDKDILEWCRKLRNNTDAMLYLLDERGLSEEVIKHARLGHDGRAITMPVHDVRTRELLMVRRRYWPTVPIGKDGKPMKYKTPKGGLTAVYPHLPDGTLILVEGEFDALVLRSHGLPGISVTSGAATRWKQEWAWMVKGRWVAVIYDAEPRAEEQAVSRAAELRREGAEHAWPVRLSRTGLKDGQDCTDWFVKYGRSAKELKVLINRERMAHLRRRRQEA
jgi:hypothetical protein